MNDDDMIKGSNGYIDDITNDSGIDYRVVDRLNTQIDYLRYNVEGIRHALMDFINTYEKEYNKKVGDQ